MATNFKHIFGTAFLLWGYLSIGQQSVLELPLEYGPYEIGFQSHNLTDHSRTFLVDPTGNQLKNGKSRPRPIQFCIWYPAEKNSGSSMFYKDYLKLKTQEIGAVALNEDQSISYLQKFAKEDQIPLEKLTQEWKTPMKALENGNPVQSKKFPVLIYGPSWWSTAFENALLFEYLASHGYIVVSSPSVGPTNREMPISRIGVETQARDMEFLLSQMHQYSNADMDKIAVAGFSLGGLSNVLMLARNAAIDAWIGIDPSIHEAYEFFSESAYEDYSKFTQPTLFINSLGYIGTLPFYDRLVYSDAYMVDLPKLEHTDLASQFIKLYTNENDKDALQLKTKGYTLLSHFIRSFLDGVFKEAYAFEDLESQVFEPSKYEESFVAITTKKGIPSIDKLINSKTTNDIIPLLESTKFGEGNPNFPVADLQKLIFELQEQGVSEQANRIMDWYKENYDNSFHSKVLEHINVNELMQKFHKLYQDNKACDFTYDQINHTAQLLSMGGKGEEAEGYFVLNTKLYPNNYKAFFNLGIGEFRMKNYSKAKLNFEKCLSLNPNNRYKNMATDLIAKCGS